MPKIRLRAPRGTDEANSSSSTIPYKVGLDGTVEVDAEAVGPLLARGGFTLADVETEPLPVGMARMAHQWDPNASCSFNGVSYSPGPDGFLMVPAVAVDALMAHGFVAVVGAPAEPDVHVAAVEQPPVEPTAVVEPVAPAAEPVAEAPPAKAGKGAA